VQKAGTVCDLIYSLPLCLLEGGTEVADGVFHELKFRNTACGSVILVDDIVGFEAPTSLEVDKSYC
jgi:hypothetical protein